MAPAIGSILIVAAAALAADDAPGAAQAPARPGAGRAHTVAPYGPVILGKPLGKKKDMPEVKLPQPELSGTASRSSFERAERARKVAACLADEGRWVAKITGYELRAYGTDVDQIYGRIHLDRIYGASIWNSRFNTAENWGVSDLWGSRKGVNLGKTPIRQLSTITVKAKGSPSLSLLFDLRDEDAARGGRDDEYFWFNETDDPKDNAVRFAFYAPPCEEAPEFMKRSRKSYTGNPPGPSAKNGITLDVDFIVMRLYP